MKLEMIRNKIKSLDLHDNIMPIGGGSFLFFEII
jgi:hypothetical protein